jgi:hypothetical protein
MVRFSREQVVTALLDFNTTVENAQALELAKSKDVRETTAAAHVKGDPQRYQAINLEHVQEEGGGARIELRRVAAQKSYEELISQLEFVYKTFVEPARIDKRAGRTRCLTRRLSHRQRAG